MNFLVPSVSAKVWRNNKKGVDDVVKRPASKDQAQVKRPLIDLFGTRKSVEDFMFCALVLYSSLYGGAHLLAWNAHFPSEIDRLLWRSLSSSLAGVVPVLLVVVSVNKLIECLCFKFE